MATPTIVFPWSPGMATPSARITDISDSSITQLSVSCTERTNSPGIYEAVFNAPAAGDYYIIPRSAGVNQEGVGIVFGVTNTAETFYESELVPPGEVTITEDNIDEIATGVVAAIQAIPGFTVEVTQPTNSAGAIEVRQGDSYLVVDNRNASIGLTGPLPSLESACALRVFFGGTVTSFVGSVLVVDSTHVTLKFPFTGTETAAMPAGTFTYEAEVTLAGTSNKWTPSTGSFTVLPQLG